MIKHPATDPTHRIGSVFFTSGGPGESGLTDLPPLYARFPPTVRARFDVVSFDPRGVGRSGRPTPTPGRGTGPHPRSW